MKRALFALAALLLAGCSEDGTGTRQASMTGRWQGTSFGVTADATLSQAGSDITGTGTLATPQGTIPITVTGTNAYPNVSLAIRAPGQPDGSFTGTFATDNTVNGSLLISGFPQVPFVLERRQ